MTPLPVQAGSLSNDQVSVLRANEHLVQAGTNEHIVIAKMLLAPVPKDLQDAQKYINELYLHDQDTFRIAENYKREIDSTHGNWCGPRFYRTRDWLLGILTAVLFALVLAHWWTQGASTHLIIDGLRWLLQDQRAVMNLH